MPSLLFDRFILLVNGSAILCHQCSLRQTAFPSFYFRQEFIWRQTSFYSGLDQNRRISAFCSPWYSQHPSPAPHLKNIDFLPFPGQDVHISTPYRKMGNAKARINLIILVSMPIPLLFRCCLNWSLHTWPSCLPFNYIKI